MKGWRPERSKELPGTLFLYPKSMCLELSLCTLNRRALKVKRHSRKGRQQWQVAQHTQHVSTSWMGRRDNYTVPVCVCVCVCAGCVLSRFNCVPTLCDPMHCSPPGSSVHRILQPRILEWVAMPSSRSSRCGD